MHNFSLLLKRSDSFTWAEAMEVLSACLCSAAAAAEAQ
jgi:hypothetical protein